MSLPIEDYALIGDLRTAALVGKNGSIDWLCMPRFDSPACFAALLGGPQHGRWRIAPRGGLKEVRRRYREGTLILETEFRTDGGTATVVDLMPARAKGYRMDVVRLVRCDRGEVPMELELTLRFDYGRTVPWVRRRSYGLHAIAGPDAVMFCSPVELVNRDFRTHASFTLRTGQTLGFSLVWHASHLHEPRERDPERLLRETETWWRRWSGRLRYDGPWREAVMRSLIVLKALTHEPTGGMVAAPTTSLPERIGGGRNWDYRYCWLRDTAFTLHALLQAGYRNEARAWREWLLRAVAGRPEEIQIMYGVAGERRLDEFELPWLPGYQDSRPVRIGNGAHAQLQLDTFGEVMDLLEMARDAGLDHDDDAWRVEKGLLDWLESNWQEPGAGIWEIRGEPRRFTHSAFMAWVAVDRGIQAVERYGMNGPAEKWRALRTAIREDVLRHGYDAERNTFVQHFGGKEVDASLLLMPITGFLPAGDPRVLGTIETVMRDLMVEGFVKRYRTRTGVDGLPQGEGAFLACTCWLADALYLAGRRDEALQIFERVLAVRNDVGLLAEEYDPVVRRQLGNFPQAFSHIALVNAAFMLAGEGAITRRGARARRPRKRD